MSQIEIRLVTTEDDFRKLSYHTLCKLSELTRYSNPVYGLPAAIRRGEYQGRLALGSTGNVIAFE